MSNNNMQWENVSAVTEVNDETFFSEWIQMEEKFGEFGTPGYSEHNLTLTGGKMLGEGNSINARFTLFRNETGKLVCIHGCHIVDGVQKPLYFRVHPDHQRQGIGTQVAYYIRDRYERENGKPFSYSESLGDATHTEATAAFVNKHAPTMISESEGNS